MVVDFGDGFGVGRCGGAVFRLGTFGTPWSLSGATIWAVVIYGSGEPIGWERDGALEEGVIGFNHPVLEILLEFGEDGLGFGMTDQVFALHGIADKVKELLGRSTIAVGVDVVES